MLWQEVRGEKEYSCDVVHLGVRPRNPNLFAPYTRVDEAGHILSRHNLTRTWHLSVRYLMQRAYRQEDIRQGMKPMIMP